MPHRTVTAAAVTALAAAMLATAQSPAQDGMGEAHDHGDGHGMYVLPGPSATTDAQRAYAERLLADAKRLGRRWSTRSRARRDGYRPFGSRPDETKTTFHYNSAARLHDGRRLDPRRPESLVYHRNGPGDVVLVAMMFRVPSSITPPHPAGALMRWHVHYRCAMAEMAPPGALAGPCTDGMRMETGATAMAHVWFVADVEHAFDIGRPPSEMFDPIPVS
jgi:hypothetical protein